MRRWEYVLMILCHVALKSVYVFLYTGILSGWDRKLKTRKYEMSCWLKESMVYLIRMIYDCTRTYHQRWEPEVLLHIHYHYNWYNTTWCSGVSNSNPKRLYICSKTLIYDEKSKISRIIYSQIPVCCKNVHFKLSALLGN